MHVGKCTRIALVKAGHTQTWLAQQLNVAPQRASEICNRKVASSRTIEKLSKIFDLAERDFITLDE